MFGGKWPGPTMAGMADGRCTSSSQVERGGVGVPGQTSVVPCFRVLTPALVLFAILAADLRGLQLLEIDGIELLGNAQLVLPGGGTCNVLESDTSYEERKQNHGAPMDIWRLDFSVHNGSGRWLDHVIARYGIESEWPECTNWDGPDASAFPQSVEWASSAGHIQESGRNVVAPGRTLTATHLFIVLRGAAEPRFLNWSMDFDFSAAPPPPGLGSAAAAQPTVPVATPEQENIFWQSIMDSTDPADFESYLEQFPNGVFRSLAQNRLSAIAKTTQTGPVGTAVAAARARPESEAARELTPLCTEVEYLSRCWLELESPPHCHVWADYIDNGLGGRVSWTGECSNGRASGTGTLSVAFDSEYFFDTAATGRIEEGKRVGPWVTRWRDGVTRGAFVDGERHGLWVLRDTDGYETETPYVEGKRHGRSVTRFSNGKRQITIYQHDEVVGHE